MNTPKPKNASAVALGKLSAKKNKKKGSRYFSEIGKKGAEKRWGKES